MKKVDFADIVPRHTRQMQNLCGGIFIALYSLNLIIRILQGYHIYFLSSNSLWYVVVLGILAVVGFIMLYNLSSNLASDIFAAGVLGFEVFFSFVMPYLLSNHNLDYDSYETLLTICIIFGCTSVYLWTVMLSNNKFSLITRPWVALLPLPYVINVAIYWGVIQGLQGHPTWLTRITSSSTVMTPIIIFAILLSAVGYWMLSHSKAFSGNKSESNFPDLSPINRYGLTYSVLIAALLILGHSLRI